MATPARFWINFTGANKAMVGLGLTPATSYVDVGDDEIHVRMGWAFSAHIPRASVGAVTLDTDRVTGWGVHGWRGQYLVNGSSQGLVRIEVEPAATARMVGVPVKLTVLRVAVTEPDRLVAALS